MSAFYLQTSVEGLIPGIEVIRAIGDGFATDVNPITEELEAVMNETTSEQAAAVSERAPFDSGATWASVKAHPTKRSGMAFQADVTAGAKKDDSDVVYSWFTEKGTKFIKAQHWFSSGIHTRPDSLIRSRIDSAIRRGIERILHPFRKSSQGGISLSEELPFPTSPVDQEGIDDLFGS